MIHPSATHYSGKVVAVNPLPAAGLLNFKGFRAAAGIVGNGASIADEFVKIKVDGDRALLQALGHLLLEAEDYKPGSVVDHDLVAAQTTGYAEYRVARASIDWTRPKPRPACPVLR